MKKLLNTSTLIAASSILMLCILSSCSEDIEYDITGDTANKVYINTHTSYVNKYQLNVIHTPVGSLGEISARFPARCTQEAGASIRVNFEIDNSLVDIYNETNSTGYSQVPGGLAQLSSSSITIPQGALASSDSLEISIAGDDLEQLVDEAYLIPVRISSVEDGGGVALRTNLNTVYLIISTIVTNCYDRPGEDDMEGAIVEDRSAWTAEMDIPVNLGSLDRLFDGNTRRYGGVYSQECNLTVNLGALYNDISGIRLHTYSRNYGITSAVVYT
ncbi:MAG: DUF1735 domain-containing protein, partial [Bacteroidales bacterium]|nr:DUF1735 domain-containing protein [Bacteroidales bacterium]